MQVKYNGGATIFHEGMRIKPGDIVEIVRIPPRQAALFEVLAEGAASLVRKKRQRIKIDEPVVEIESIETENPPSAEEKA